MNGIREEYLGPVNGDHKKAFRVLPNEPDFAPINARDRVIEDNDLHLGARLMFVRILDLSTRESVREHYGAVTISQNKLAHKFNVSLRTIWSWKQQLLAKGAIWMTQKFMPNAWPMDTYHITELDPPGQTEGRTSLEGMWGNGTRQQTPERIGLGAREPGQTVIPGTAADRNQLRATAETGCEPPPKPVAAGSRSRLRT